MWCILVRVIECDAVCHISSLSDIWCFVVFCPCLGMWWFVSNYFCPCFGMFMSCLVLIM